MKTKSHSSRKRSNPSESKKVSAPSRDTVSDNAKPYAKYLGSVVKLAFVAALIYFLVQRGFISVQATRGALAQWDRMLWVLFIMFLAQGLGVTRWKLLLDAQGISLRWTRILKLTLVGFFFNIALPGAVSGDFVKAYYIGKEVPGKRTRAFGSIMFDRVAGLSALVLVSAGCLAIEYETYRGSALLTAIGVFLGAAASGVLAFYTYLFLVKEKHDPLLIVLGRIEASVKWVGSIKRVYEGLRHYHNHRIRVLVVLGLSCVIQIVVGWTCLQFAYALGEVNVSLTSVLIVVPLGLLVIAVPIAPAGVGTGNVAFLYLFGLIGCSRGADVYSLLAMVNIFFGCIGGLVYSRFKSVQTDHDTREMMHQTVSG